MFSYCVTELIVCSSFLFPFQAFFIRVSRFVAMYIVHQAKFRDPYYLRLRPLGSFSHCPPCVMSRSRVRLSEKIDREAQRTRKTPDAGKAFRLHYMIHIQRYFGAAAGRRQEKMFVCISRNERDSAQCRLLS